MNTGKVVVKEVMQLISQQTRVFACLALGVVFGGTFQAVAKEQPWQGTFSCNDGPGGTTGGGASCSFPKPPAGKILVIEHVTVEFSLAPGQTARAILYSFSPRDSNWPHVSFPLAATSFVGQNANKTLDLRVINAPIRLYVTPGTVLTQSPMMIWERSGSGYASAVVTLIGYLKDE